MSSVGGIASGSSPPVTTITGSKLGHGAKPAGGGASASSSASTNTTSVVPNQDGSVTTTVTAANGNTVSVSTVAGAAPALGSTFATYAPKGTQAQAASQGSRLNISA